jgi:hypothetical protein
LKRNKKRDVKHNEKEEAKAIKRRERIDVTSVSEKKKSKTERWIIINTAQYQNCKFFPLAGS